MTQILAEDAPLVERARDGDLDAFQALYERYVDRIHDFAYQMVRNHHEAADVTSDTFLKAMESLRTLREPGAFRGWLYTIARNAALSTISARKKTTHMPDDFEVTSPIDTVAAPDPSVQAEQAELRQLVWEAAATLNPRDYSIFEMTVRQGLSSGEVADALGVKPSHAYVLVNRLKDSVDDALGAVVLARVGRRDCAELDAVVKKFGNERTPKMRKAILRHARACDVCTSSRRKYASAGVLLGGLGMANASEMTKAEIAQRIADRWDTHGPHIDRPRPGTTMATRVLTVAAIVVAIVALSIQPWRDESTPVAELATTAPSPTVEPMAEATSEPTATPPTTSDPTAQPTSAPPQTTGPQILSTSASPRTIYTTAACGPTTSAITVRYNATGVRSVRVSAAQGNTQISRATSGDGGQTTIAIGPFPNAGPVTYWAEVTDGSGQTARSAPGTLQVQECQEEPRPTPTPTPLRLQ